MDEQQYERAQMPQMPQLPKNLGRKIAIGIIVLVVLVLGSTSFYTVQEQEKAAILTFGKYTSTSDAGLHLKLPYPIQQVVKVQANITQRIEIGYRENNGQIVAVEDEALMITGDENIVSADAVVEWRVGDMEAFLYNIEDPEVFLVNSASAAIRSVIGSQPLDYVITDGKTVVQTQVKEKLDELNEKYNTGIFIQDLKFQDIEPPEGEVQEAFRDVTNAREEKNTKVNNARKYENDRIPKARGEAQALIEQAEAEKESRILNARGDVAKFNALYEAYKNNPQVTESRLIIETLETILPNARIFVTDGSGDTVKYLPLNELMNTRSSSSSESTTQPRGSGAQ
ncbi:FtsH protease activity modulator HflK [Xylanibacillus composti]|uniref:Protein HflK n=1 Tax=Xylanibacillus composti TaxID=1572762 RepID=A0A8J4H142_9BACL|nr:FtsH protease activity modulator HflK [Xylanibacillus composti]GIQ67481.1 protease modulator HflK [Xylanibacillus composti]